MRSRGPCRSVFINIDFGGKGGAQSRLQSVAIFCPCPEDHEISSATKALERARSYLGDARLKVEVLKTALEESNTVSST